MLVKACRICISWLFQHVLIIFKAACILTVCNVGKHWAIITMNSPWWLIKAGGLIHPGYRVDTILVENTQLFLNRCLILAILHFTLYIFQIITLVQSICAPIVKCQRLESNLVWDRLGSVRLAIDLSDLAGHVWAAFASFHSLTCCLCYRILHPTNY